MISIKQRDPDSGLFILKSFPLIDVVPADVCFGVTGLSYGETGVYIGWTGSLGDTALFGETGLSSPPIAYNWDFGDGDNSTDPDPSHTYSTYGYHRVFLRVKDNTSIWFNVSGYTANHIILGKADFSAAPVYGDKPLSVNFEEENITPTGLQFTGLQWDFGDTFGATGSSPMHNYVDYGSYSVDLETYLGLI